MWHRPASPRLWLLWGLVFVLPARLLAIQAEVATREGKTYQGYIRMSTNLVVVANADKGYIIHVGLSNLLVVTCLQEPRLQSLIEEPPPGSENALPRSWQSEDIGGTHIPGSVSFVSGLFRVKSSGTNISGDDDSFHFVYQPVNGNSEIVARVLQVPFTAPGAEAGLMMRADLTADSPNVFLAVTAGRRGLLQWREAKGAPTKLEPQRGLAVPYWLKLKRDGDVFASYSSRNGSRWWLVDKTALPMPAEIYVGLAVASGSAQRLNRSTFDNVREAPWLPNPSFVTRAELRSGSVVMGPIQAADATHIYLAGPPARPPIPVQEVSKLLFNWLPPSLPTKRDAGRAGVLLADGEFIEGEFNSFQDGYVIISSVLFGLRRYDASQEVIAVFLRPATRGSGRPYEVKTLDGSTWLGDDLEIGWNEVVLDEPALGNCRFPIYELAEVRRK